MLCVGYFVLFVLCCCLFVGFYVWWSFNITCCFLWFVCTQFCVFVGDLVLACVFKLVDLSYISVEVCFADCGFYCFVFVG